jgi:hypothetical protein
MKGPPPPPPPERVKVTVGGFVAAETVWRQRNQVADIASNFGAIPYPFSPLYNEHEFHGSAKTMRLLTPSKSQNRRALAECPGHEAAEPDPISVGVRQNG